MSKIKGYWTFDRVKEEALKYKTRNDFNKLSKSAYLAAHRNGWLDDVCSHMKIVNTYDFDKVKEEALKYTSRVDFKKGSLGCYASACRNGWIDEVCSHMQLQGSLYKRQVYIASFDDNSIYIGLTFNFNKRKSEHLSRNSSVYNYMIKTGLEPVFKIISEELLSNEEAAKLECDLIEHYKSLGFNVLNKAKGGGLGGSIKIWTLERVKEEALKYNSRNEFKINSPSAYIIANRNKWLNDVCYHMTGGRKLNGYWTLERVKEEALKYRTKKEFEKGSISAYNIAHKNGWIEDICSHMVSGRFKNLDNFNEWFQNLCS